MRDVVHSKVHVIDGEGIFEVGFNSKSSYEIDVRWPGPHPATGVVVSLSVQAAEKLVDEIIAALEVLRDAGRVKKS